MTLLAADDAAAGREWLSRKQFELVHARGGDTGPFGDLVEDWERHGTLVRVTSDRSQWWADITREGSEIWLDAFEVGGAVGEKSQLFIHHLAQAVGVDDGVFGALADALKPSP